VKILICTFGNTAHYACRIFYALLKDISDARLVFFNGKWNQDTENFISEYMRTESPDLVAVSLLTFELGLCKELSKTIRRLSPSGKTKIIFGGPYIFCAPETCFDVADFVCTGEGEYTLLGLCDQFKKTKRWEDVNLKNIPNLLYRLDGKVCKSGIQDFYYSHQFIDALPFPAYGIDGIHVYDGINWVGDTEIYRDYYFAFASRGCPNSCSYCVNSIRPIKKVTHRSPEKIVEEIALIKDKFPRLKRICFADEVFCCQSKWTADFSRLYKERIALPFECDSFPGMHPESVIKTLAETGLKKVNIGVQSCSKRILKEVFARPQKTEHIINDNKVYLKYGVMPTYDFIIDNPFESPDEFRETLEIVRQLERPLFFRVYSLFFFPYHALTVKAELMGLYRKANGEKDFYDKLTTTHTGDQCCQKEWYTKPLRTILRGDQKAALNWILIFYGNATIPKKLADLAFAGHKRGSWFLTVLLAYFYLSINSIYALREKVRITSDAYKRHGFVPTVKHIAKKICR